MTDRGLIRRPGARSGAGSPLRRRVVAAAVVAVAGVAGASATVATATTGPGVIESRAPEYKIPQYTTDLYLGGYEMKSVSPDAHIILSNMTIQESAGTWGLFTGGVIQFQDYLTNGKEQAWIGTLYDAHEIDNNPNKIAMNILDTDDDLMGTLSFQRLPQGSLAGVLTLPKQPNPYNQETYPGSFAIFYKKTRTTKPPVSDLGVGNAKLQGYEIPGLPPKGLKLGTASPTTTLGWGAPSSYRGSYRLVSAATVPRGGISAAPTGKGAGIFSSVIKTAFTVVAGAPPSGGRLTLGRSSGTLRLSLPDSRGPLRVERYVSFAGTRSATLLDSTGKSAGVLQVTSLTKHKLVGTINLTGGALFEVKFAPA